jgi:hypothetical protein
MPKPSWSAARATKFAWSAPPLRRLYFEETSLGQIRDGDPAIVKLMGYSQSFMAVSVAWPVASTSRTRDRITRGLPR